MPEHRVRSRTPRGEWRLPPIVRDPDAVEPFLHDSAHFPGGRATGIGCFYDDPVHDVLGLRGHSFQSLYHFTVGMPVEDTRLTTQPGYEWEGN